jgi:hypothetical protein
MCCGDIIQFFKYSTVSDGREEDLRLLPLLVDAVDSAGEDASSKEDPPLAVATEFSVGDDVMSTTTRYSDSEDMLYCSDSNSLVWQPDNAFKNTERFNLD